MKVESKYLLLAYLPSVLLILFLLLCLKFINYGEKAEAGTIPILLTPYFMILSGLLTIIILNVYLRKNIGGKISWKTISFKVLKIIPAIFLSCLQLYGALMFLGLI